MESDKPDKPDAFAAPAVVQEIRFEGVEFEYSLREVDGTVAEEIVV